MAVASNFSSRAGAALFMSVLAALLVFFWWFL
jgi:hypothetical protein